MLEVAQTRLRGDPLENDECLVGVCALAASVSYREGQTTGTISVAGATSRAGEQLNEFAEPVRDAAAQASPRLGAPREGRWHQ
jgi:DNA-binding IclR family transcriptional regulator